MDIIAGINEKNNRVFKTFFEKNFSSIVMFADKYLDDMEVACPEMRARSRTVLIAQERIG